MTKPTINRRQLLGTAAVGAMAVPLAGCTGVSRKDSQPHYVMVFDQNKCVGCGECKIACNEANKLPKGRTRVLMQLNGVRPDGSNKKDRHYTRVSCQQCEEAPCVRVCPTGAAHRDKETGIVTVDADLCIGCKYCIVACPYNVRYIREVQPITAISVWIRACPKATPRRVFRPAASMLWSSATSTIRTHMSPSCLTLRTRCGFARNWEPSRAFVTFR